MRYELDQNLKTKILELFPGVLEKKKIISIITAEDWDKLDQLLSFLCIDTITHDLLLFSKRNNRMLELFELAETIERNRSIYDEFISSFK